MDRLTISQVTACVESATRHKEEAVTIDYPALTAALNAIFAIDSMPEPQLQWCDVCQRNVEPNHVHDKMVSTVDRDQNP